jgi:hypothetical protein
MICLWIQLKRASKLLLVPCNNAYNIISTYGWTSQNENKLKIKDIRKCEICMIDDLHTKRAMVIQRGIQTVNCS